MKREFTIRLAEWDQDAEKLKAVRHAVFVVEQGVSEVLEWDKHDQDALHILALGQKCEPVGTSRLLKTGQIGRIAVLKHYRNNGVGKALLQKIITLAEDRGFSSVFVHAQTPVIPFYKPFGFKVEGRPFYEANIEHYLMSKSLPGNTNEC